MGSLHAAEFAGLVKDREIALDTALTWHLQSNHYPPVPVSMVPVCKRAIENANRGQWEARVRLPQGVRFQGQKLAPVHEVVRQHHLESFLEEGA